MSVPTLFGLCAAALVGFGLYGVITNPQPLRKILGFNLIGNGAFLLFGAIARRGAAAGPSGDPVPHGLLITNRRCLSATALQSRCSAAVQATGTAARRRSSPPRRKPMTATPIPYSMAVENMTTPGGLLLVLVVLVPFIGCWQASYRRAPCPALPL
jgi:multicomponent Na+:H+ antiporter subunit C